LKEFSWQGVAATHVLAKIYHVVINIGLEIVPLISASGVLTRAIALANRTVLVLILFESRVAVLRVQSGGNVRHRILVVNNTVLFSKLSIWECSVLSVTNAWLTEVDHRRFYSISNQVHDGKLGESRTEWVSSGLDGSSGMNGLKAFDLS